MRKPTDKQFAKAHPEFNNCHVKIHKHYNGVTCYVEIVKDVEFDSKGRVTKAIETKFILNEALELAKPYGGECVHVHKYGQRDNSTTFCLGGDDPTVHNHIEV